VSRAVTVGLAAILWTGGCAPSGGSPAASRAPSAATSAPSASTAPPSRDPEPSAVPTMEPTVRTVGGDEQGSTITVRVGDVLDVVPPARSGGWRVTGYPSALLRLHGDPGPAARHAFDAYAVGEGSVTLAGSTPAVFTVRVRVLRALVQNPQP
jgi:hypothetical protein